MFMEVNFLTFKSQFGLQKSYVQNPVQFRGNLAADTFESSCAQNKPRPARKEVLAGKYERDAAKYNEQLEHNPGSAFLYNPDIKVSDRYNMALESETVRTVGDTAQMLGVSSAALRTWAAAGCIEIDDMGAVFTFGSMPHTAFIDTEFPKNKEFFNSIRPALETSVSGAQLVNLDRISPSTLQTHLKNGELKPLGFDEKPYRASIESVYFDLNDETNAKTITALRRITPHASKKYFKAGGHTMVPVKYLEKLGYGDAKSLAKLVQKGKLPGTIEAVDVNGTKKYRVYVDIEPYVASEEKLIDLRKANPNVANIQELARELGMTRTEIRNAIMEGRLDIIDEYIFSDDSGILINKATSKNAEFIDKALFEKQAAEELLQEKRAEQKRQRLKRLHDPLASLRMKLVWSMCPNTKAIASDTAKHDGLASAVIAKRAREEELTDKEDKKYRSYCESFWAKAGAEEFTIARAKADAIIEQYKKAGVEGVQDPEAKKIIEEFLKDSAPV